MALCVLLGAARAPAVSPACHLPAGWHEIVGDKARFVILGEVHGTAQSPAMLANIACSLAKRRERLLVGVELGVEQDAELQQAWASPLAGFQSRLVATMPDWTQRNDGVTSQAMLAMLVRLHALKAGGASIDVVAFNGISDDAQRAKFSALPGPGQHEAAQADNIRRAADRGHYDHVLVLVGNYHARKHTVTMRGVMYEPMAMRLAPATETISLNMAYNAGTSWNCQVKGPMPASGLMKPDSIDCGAHALSALVDWKGRPRLVGAADMPANANPDSAYDGAFFVGPVIASPSLSQTP
jgi:hypothetical protein